MPESPTSVDERRTETRLGECATVFVELLAANYDLSEPAQVSICSSIDVSANGLQVQLDHPVEVGSILRLCAEFADQRAPLFLVGEVKWLQPEAGEYRAGFALFESEQTDISAWKRLMAAHLDTH